ncbi:hypothetical protein ACFT2C_29065, partial [Promicromonospora sp. NPDC057138]|uniref:hypothetical protein n=1 Tax=Promicromonospora sp. NPDC057138 TaxID=3346031 RepID=UPI003624F3CF
MTTALAQPALLLREPGAGKLLNQLPQPTTRQTSTDPMRQHPTRPPQPHEQQSFRKSNPAPPPLPAYRAPRRKGGSRNDPTSSVITLTVAEIRRLLEHLLPHQLGDVYTRQG